MVRRTTIAVAGEYLAVRPVVQVTDPGLLAIRDLLHSADVAYAHLEMNFGSFDQVHAGRGDTFGNYMLADPQVARDLRWLGVDVLSMGNNHSLDFGQRGLLSTLGACRRGRHRVRRHGRDLDEARAPAYVDTPGGRVALVSTASGNEAQEWAGRPKDTMVGRPGINPLRVSMGYEVDAPSATALREAARDLVILRASAQTGPGRTGQELRSDQFQVTLPGGQSAPGEFVFREGEEHRIETRCHAGDLEGNLRAIRSAAAQADIVMVAHHFNLSEGPPGDRPPAFVREFAHHAIDEGANLFLGHGWHKTLGIDIYRGKPIFYGLRKLLLPVPFPRARPCGRLRDLGARSGSRSDADAWRPTGRRRAPPIELGRDVSPEAPITRRTGGPEDHPLVEGRPRLALGGNARQVLERIQRLSEEFGTEPMIGDGVGSLHLGVPSAVAIGG